MSQTNKVTWSEGMFLYHLHFQQQDRHTEQLVKACLDMAIAYGWGFSKLTLDQQHLALGRIAISECAGIFNDGTIFDSRVDCDTPPFYQVPENLHNAVLYLAVPLRGVDLLETSVSNAINLARYRVKEVVVRDNTSEEHAGEPIHVSRLNLRILSDQDDLSQYSVLPFAKVIERRADGSIILDAKFIPPCLDIRVSPILSSFLQELQGLLHNRGEDLAARVTKPGVSGLSSMLDFLLLQLINRYESFFHYLSEGQNVHPERFYSELLKLYGELITVTSSTKRLHEHFSYQHNQLTTSFLPIFDGIREALSVVLEQRAIPLKLQMTKQGIRVALLKDKNLLDSAQFVLAAKAEVPADNLRNRFPAQLKIGPVEKIRGLINIMLPGIAVEPLSVAPPEIPYHAGFTYFELDKNSQFWKHMMSSTGFAFHVSGEFPGLELEFWAIKGA
jgi:type VI secretion system protein ImpJ